MSETTLINLSGINRRIKRMLNSFTVLVIRISDQDGEDVRRNTFANFTMDTTSELLENVFIKSAVHIHRRNTVRREPTRPIYARR